MSTVTTVDAESTPIEPTPETQASESSTPETGAAASADANGGSGALGLWGFIALFFARIVLPMRRRSVNAFKNSH